MSAAHVNQYSNIPVFILALPAKELGLCNHAVRISFIKIFNVIIRGPLRLLIVFHN